MTMTDALDLGRQTLGVVVLVCLPPLGLGLLVGVCVSLIQAVTQLQDQTFSFIPKILAVAVALFVFGPWMLQTLVSFAGRIFHNLPHYGH